MPTVEVFFTNGHGTLMSKKLKASHAGVVTAAGSSDNLESPTVVVGLEKGGVYVIDKKHFHSMVIENDSEYGSEQKSAGEKLPEVDSGSNPEDLPDPIQG